MRISLVISMAALSVAIGSFGSGIFGMNLLSGWEEAPTRFRDVTFTLLTLAGGFFSACFVYYRNSKQSVSTFSRLSSNVNEMRYKHQSQRLYKHSDRSKLLYNYSTATIGNKEQYERFLRNNQVDFLCNTQNKYNL